MARERRGPPPPSDADAGIWQGRSVARVFRSPDGMIVLVGRTAADNDLLSLRLASPRDFWMHVSGHSGSHVVVRNPEGLSRLPRDTKLFAAGLAVRFSAAKKGGRLVVHLCRARDLSKPRGLPPGKVHIKTFESVRAAALEDADEERELRIKE